MTGTTSFFISFIALFVIIAIRYFAIAGLFYWLLWGRDPEHVAALRLSKGSPDRAVVLHEIKWSMVSSQGNRVKILVTCR